MKLITGLISILCFTMIARAQDKEIRVLSPANRAKCYNIDVDLSKSALVSVPFRSLQVYDVRPDTSKLGYFSGANQVFYKFCYEGNPFTEYYHSQINYTDTNSNFDLVIFIRKCWISVKDSISIQEGTKSKTTVETLIVLNAEFLLKDNKGFYPLYKFDTSVYSKGRVNSFAVRSLEKLMSASVQKLASINYTGKTAKSIPASVIDSRYNRGSYIIKGKPTRGVYLTFDQFRANIPAYPDYSIEKDKLTDILYVKEADGKHYPMRRAWGFSDEKNSYIRMGDNYFPLGEDGDVYSFFGVANLKDLGSDHYPFPTVGVGGMVVAGVLDAFLRKKQRLETLRAYQLNLLTGEVY